MNNSGGQQNDRSKRARVVVWIVTSVSFAEMSVNSTQRLLNVGEYSDQQSHTVTVSSGSYVPPRPHITTVHVSADSEVDTDGTSTNGTNEEDDGFKAFPSMFVMPAVWQIVLFLLLVVLAVLSFTVLKHPLESIGVTSTKIIKYGSIPVISVAFTYFHIWLALWLTFYVSDGSSAVGHCINHRMPSISPALLLLPLSVSSSDQPLTYVGCLQIPGTNLGLGWQGIIPFKSEKMARMAVKLMTTRLFDVREIFARLDPAQVAAEMGPALHVTLDRVISGVARAHSAALWDMLPARVRAEVITQAHEDAPPMIADMMLAMQASIHDVIDIEDMVIRSLVRDPALLNNIFIACGHAELGFIRNSGAYMGALFGCIQMVIWIVYANKWLLPAFGFVVGALTNALALKMIFEPVVARYPCGPRGLKIQGLFLQRQAEVSDVYARTISRRVMTSKNILAALIAGPTTEKLFSLVHAHVSQACDAFAGGARPLLHLAVGGETYARVREDVCARLLDALPPLLSSLESYADRALDIETTLREKMAALPSEDFESLLHPIFQEDEWKLVLGGGVLGLAIGFLQIQILGS